MFLRTVKAQGGKGVQHEYVRLVEAYREHGKNKQRVVCNLGRKDVLAAHLDDLIRLLRGERAGPAPFRAGNVEATGAWDWGPVLVARTLWRELGLDASLAPAAGRGRPAGPALAERALVLVANRLCAPTSEHGLARWLETDFVCDGQGRRWLPAWREEAERRASRRPRVRVRDRQLQQWYRTLDQLHARQARLEQALYLRLRDLFSLRVDLVFYDLTSTYFEGAGPPTLGAHGHSRDGKPRDPQVLVGVVMVEDWPIAHHVFRGNLRDATTLRPVLQDLESRFGLRRIVLVGDRGLVTGENLTLLQGDGHGYLVGLNRRRNEAVARYLARATGPWTECPGRPGAGELPAAPKTYVQEVPAEAPGVRVFVVKSEERLAYERTEREKAMARVRTGLEALQRRVAQGKLKAPEKVGAAAARLLGRHHGHRYYGWEYTDGLFRFFEHPEALPREQALEGTYVLQTTEAALTPVQAVTLYKRLSEVERAFCHLKDVIELRPIYHQTDPRVAAHIFVAALAFLLHRALEKKLKAAGLDLSATEALQALRTVRVVEIQLGNGQTKRSVTRGTARAARILSALGITELDPPTPPKEVSRAM
jgi:transposase